jgi:hypothetical protein
MVPKCTEENPDASNYQHTRTGTPLCFHVAWIWNTLPRLKISEFVWTLAYPTVLDTPKHSVDTLHSWMKFLKDLQSHAHASTTAAQGIKPKLVSTFPKLQMDLQYTSWANLSEWCIQPCIIYTGVYTLCHHISVNGGQMHWRISRCPQLSTHTYGHPTMFSRYMNIKYAPHTEDRWVCLNACVSNCFRYTEAQLWYPA